MRLISKKEFLKLNTPVLFSEACKYYQNDGSVSYCQDFQISIATEMIPELGDFYYFDLGENIDAPNCSSNYEEITKAIKCPSYNIPFNYVAGRDGMYEDDDMFFVYNKEEINQIMSEIQKCLEAVK